MPDNLAIAEALKNLIYPEHLFCHTCGKYIARFPEDILCDCCRWALNAELFQPWESLHCGYDENLRVFSAFPHKGISRELVHRLKYESDLQAANPLAEGMCKVLIDAQYPLSEVDMVIPVPLHPIRLQKRGYNQALVLAEAFCKHFGFIFTEHYLKRARFSDSQVGRNKTERIEAMRDVFQASEILQGEHIIIIDDVCTTGATGSACAEVLKKAGAGQITLVTACSA